MGTFTHSIELGSVDRGQFEVIEALVDTGSTYTWVPSSILRRLGIRPSIKQQFRTADGRLIDRDVAEVVARSDGQKRYTLCIFGDEGSESLLGVVTLEEFGLAVDPVNRRLVPTPGYLMEVKAFVQKALACHSKSV